MYSSFAHCKQTFFHKSECCWTYRTVAPRRSKCFNENTLTFSHSTVRIKLKFLYGNIQSCNNVQQQRNLHRSTKSRFELRTLESCRNRHHTTLRKILVKAGHNSDKKIIMKTCLNPFVRAGRNYGFRDTMKLISTHSLTSCQNIALLPK